MTFRKHYSEIVMTGENETLDQDMQITRKKKLKKQYYVKQVMPRGVHM
jgi:hypothetical protein